MSPESEKSRPAWTGERWALGLMSGTSLDGIDIALLRSDGERRIEAGGFATFPYEPAFRERLRAILGQGERSAAVRAVEEEVTLLHADAVAALLAREGLAPGDVGVIGFHGHTVAHNPGIRLTLQIGDGALLARRTGIDVVADFRSRDVAAGGHGAPFAPLFHAAMTADLKRPLAVLNLGGVGNVTWIGRAEKAEIDRDGPEDRLLAFDTGPGNALIDDWVQRHTGATLDQDGALAGSGRVDQAVLAALLDNSYFTAPPPKSLDRNDFDPVPVASLSAADGAATLTAFTAASVRRACDWFPSAPERWLVTGGGRHNPTLMAALAERLSQPVAPVESIGWDGDAIEAQAFAFLAVRALRRLPLSLPSTTGVPEPTCGGVFCPAA